MRQQVMVWTALLVLFVVTSLPAFHSSLFRVHDFLHAARTAEMVRMLQDRQFPPQWSSNFGYGYGMPLFEFYAPLPSFFSSIFVFLGVPIAVTTQLLFLTINAGTILGAYFFGKKLFDAQSGLVLAGLYALAPYRAVDLFVRGALSESWALATYPWILLGVVGIFQKKTWGIYLFIVSLCSLFLSHNVSTVLFAPILLGFIVLQMILTNSKKSKDKLTREAVLQTLFGGVVAVCISAFYLFPAYLEKNYTQVAERIVEGYFALSNHFISPRQLLVPNWGYGGSVADGNDGLSFFVGYPQLTLLALGGVVLLRELVLHRNQHKKIQSRFLYLFFFLLVTAVSYFMTLRFSSAIWSSFTLLSFTQFPWRWLGIGSLFIGCVAAVSLTYLTNKRIKTIVVVSVLVITALLNYRYFQPEAYLGSAEEYYFDDATRIRDEMSSVLPDYLPKEFIEQPYRAEIAWSEDSSLVSTTQLDSSNVKEARVVTSEPILATLRVADYPGWQVSVNGVVTSHTRDATGLIQVPLASGQHTITARFEKTRVRQISALASLLGVVVLGSYALYTTLRRVL